MFSVSRKISLNLSLISGKISVNLRDSRDGMQFRKVQCIFRMSWKVRGRFVESTAKRPWKNPKNKYDYAEYDVIRVIIVSFAGTARLAEQRRVTAPRRGTRRTETAAPRPVSCTRACHGDQRRARGGSRGRVGRVAPSN